MSSALVNVSFTLGSTPVLEEVKLGTSKEANLKIVNLPVMVGIFQLKSME